MPCKAQEREPKKENQEDTSSGMHTKEKFNRIKVYNSCPTWFILTFFLSLGLIVFLLYSAYYFPFL